MKSLFLRNLRVSKQLLLYFLVDHVVVGLCNEKTSEINFNKDEASELKFEKVSSIVDSMKKEENKYLYTPWFYNIILEKGNEIEQVFSKFFLENEVNQEIRSKFESNIKLRKAEYVNI